MKNLKRAQQLYTDISNGKIMEAFDKYYAEEVVMEEPRGKREGKEACRVYEEAFVNSVKEFHGMTVKAIAEDVENEKVLLEIDMDITFKDGSRVLMEQVAVQKWDNGQIVHERFYYNA